jgi:glycosyltransferase involved in cell wall biosynthesis
MRPPKRIIVVPSRYPFGYQEAYLSTELGELSKYFDRIVVAPLRPAKRAAVQRVPHGIDVLAWPLVSFELLRRAILAFRSRPKETLRVLRDVLRSHDPGRTKNLAIIIKALALAQWTMENEFDHIHAYWISAPATLAYIAASVSGVAWSATAHRWDIYERNAFDLKGRTASFVRTISERGTTDIGTRMPSVADRIVQLRLGTEVPPPPPSLERRNGVFRIVCPAALVPIKGHADLLAALVLLRAADVPIQCTLAGVGPLREALEEKVKSMRLGDVVTFAGLVPQTTLHAWYRDGRFAAVVLASRVETDAMEGVPSALIEAMAFGVPVVATDSGSIGELVDEQCGRLTPAGHPQALANALLDLYANPAAARERAQKAYELVARQHDVRTQMRMLATVLAESGSNS